MKIRASMLPRLRECPGALRACSGLPGETSAEATSGQRIHRALERCVRLSTRESMGILETGLVEAEKQDDILSTLIIEERLDDREAAVARLFARELRSLIMDAGGIHNNTIAPELAVWLNDENGMKWLTGHIDLAVQTVDDGWHIVDYKTGRIESEQAHEQLQLAAYAVMLAHGMGVNRVSVHILDAARKWPEVRSSCLFQADDLAAAEAEIVAIRDAATADNAERTPGPEQCKYCSARGTKRCPESTAMVAQYATSAQRADLPAVFADLPPANRALVVDQCRTLKPIIERILMAAREVIMADPDGDPVPGYTVTPGSTTRKIIDEQGAIVALRKAGMEDTEILLAVSLSLPKLERVAWEKEKRIAEGAGEKPMTQNAAKNWLCDRLGDLIVESKKAGSLKKLKG